MPAGTRLGRQFVERVDPDGPEHGGDGLVVGADVPVGE